MSRVVVLLALLSSSAAGALERYDTARLRFVAGPGAEALARDLAATGEADRDLVAQDVGRDWDGITEVRVAADELAFRVLLPENERVPAWAIGVAFPADNLVVLQARPGDRRARETLRHELSHIALGRLAPGRVPRWFLEGLAAVREGALWSRDGLSLVWAARTGHLQPLSALSTSFPAGRLDAELAYAQSADVVQFLFDEAGEGRIQELVRAVVAGSTFEDAVRNTLGEDMRVLEDRWRRHLGRWEAVTRWLASPQLLWSAITLLFLAAWWSMRRRSKLRLRLLEIEEQTEAARALAERQTIEEPEIVAPPAEDDGIPLLQRPQPPPKKPTLH